MRRVYDQPAENPPLTFIVPAATHSDTGGHEVSRCRMLDEEESFGDSPGKRMPKDVPRESQVVEILVATFVVWPVLPEFITLRDTEVLTSLDDVRSMRSWCSCSCT